MVVIYLRMERVFKGLLKEGSKGLVYIDIRMGIFIMGIGKMI